MSGTREPRGRSTTVDVVTTGGTRNGTVLTGRRGAESVVTLLSRDVREGASR
ncbi:hypothetical protein ACIRFH_30250 [Streptomyces sp. NPDC093586]|uniref:hypothetical protein n=1 Tax=Streptomyces sp. NPDC093586 TaxID=3366042 RepID=UPI00380F35B9